MLAMRPLQLGVERIYINTVDGRFGIYLIGDGIPVERTYRLFQLTCLTQRPSSEISQNRPRILYP